MNRAAHLDGHFDVNVGLWVSHVIDQPIEDHLPDNFLRLELEEPLPDPAPNTVKRAG